MANSSKQFFLDREVKSVILVGADLSTFTEGKVETLYVLLKIDPPSMFILLAHSPP